MATLINPGAASAVPFDASAWLAAWSDHGGVVMLAVNGTVIFPGTGKVKFPTLLL